MISIAAIAIVLGYGTLRIDEVEKLLETEPRVEIAMVQANFDYAGKNPPQRADYNGKTQGDVTRVLGGGSCDLAGDIGSVLVPRRRFRVQNRSPDRRGAGGTPIPLPYRGDSPMPRIPLSWKTAGTRKISENTTRLF